MRLGEVMKTAVKTVPVDQPADAAWELMRLYRMRHLIVADGKHVLGVVTDADLGGRYGEGVRKHHVVGELMSIKPTIAAPETTVREAANLMKSNLIACLPIVDREKLVGIVTAADLLGLIGHGLENPVPRGKRWVLKDRGANKHHRRVPAARPSR